MNLLGDINKTSKGVNKESGGIVTLLQVVITDEADVQTVQLMSPPGLDVTPCVGDRVAIIDYGASLKVAFVVSDGIEPDTQEGESKIYSRDEGVIKGFIKILKTGKILIEGSDIVVTPSGQIELAENSDYAVKYNALEAKLQYLIGLIQTHIHPGVAAGGSNTGISATVFATDFATAKATKVRL